MYREWTVDGHSRSRVLAGQDAGACRIRRITWANGSGFGKPKTIEPRISDMPADELLTVVDAATYLAIRPSTLRHWISDHKIDVVKYGNGAVRIKRSVLDRYVAICTIKARHEHGRAKESGLLKGSGLGQSDDSVAR
jgi:excisionase family DNA binding protein